MNIVIDDADLDPEEVREVFQRVFFKDVRSVEVGGVKTTFGHTDTAAAERHFRLFGARLHN